MATKAKGKPKARTKAKTKAKAKPRTRGTKSKTKGGSTKRAGSLSITARRRMRTVEQVAEPLDVAVPESHIPDTGMLPLDEPPIESDREG
jgi:hypothetical protein